MGFRFCKLSIWLFWFVAILSHSLIEFGQVPSAPYIDNQKKKKKKKKTNCKKKKKFNDNDDDGRVAIHLLCD